MTKKYLKICTVSILHDIGAYKVAERDKLVDIDTISPFDHAVYGSLFIKYFSPLSDSYKIILNHHFNEKYFKDNHEKLRCEEGLLLSFSDYLDRLYLNEKLIDIDYLEKNCKNYLRRICRFIFKSRRRI